MPHSKWLQRLMQRRIWLLQVKYVTIAGRYVKGAKLTGPGSWQAKFAGAGYQQVCGDAEVWGDFIVPESAVSWLSTLAAVGACCSVEH